MSGGYWEQRYRETLAIIDQTKCPRVQLAYCDLAHHYQAMLRLYGSRVPLSNAGSTVDSQIEASPRHPGLAACENPVRRFA